VLGFECVHPALISPLLWVYVPSGRRLTAAEKANRTSPKIETSDWPDRPYSGAVTAKGGAIRVSANGFIFHIARRKQSETITD